MGALNFECTFIILQNSKTAFIPFASLNSGCSFKAEIASLQTTHKQASTFCLSIDVGETASKVSRDIFTNSLLL